MRLLARGGECVLASQRSRPDCHASPAAVRFFNLGNSALAPSRLQTLHGSKKLEA